MTPKQKENISKAVKKALSSAVMIASWERRRNNEHTPSVSTPKPRKQPLECCYINTDGVFTRINCTELDRGTTPKQTLKDCMDNGTVVFVDRKGNVLAECEPHRLSWVRTL